MTSKREKQALSRGLRYVGQGGEHLTGVPAQDLPPETVQRLSDRQLQAVLERTDLYHLMPATGADEAAAAAEEE